MFTWGGSHTGQPATAVDVSDGCIDGRSILAAVSDQLGPATERERELDSNVEQSCSGTTQRLVVPGRDLTVTDAELGTQYPINSPSELPAGEFLLTTHGAGSVADGGGPSTVYVRFPGPASVKSVAEAVIISFWERTTVTVGYESSCSTSPPQLTVEPNPSGVATAISHLSNSHQTAGPARSHPGFRDHPPLVRIGNETEIPASLRNTTATSDVTLSVPPSIDSLFVAAPLAYYLGAQVVTDDSGPAHLTTAEADVEYTFDPLPGFQHQCAQLFRRVFYLDCHVRRVASGGDRESERLETEFGLDPAVVQALAPGERLEHYLEVPVRELDAILPDWHLSTYVSPEPRHVQSLPHLLDRLSLVYLPQASKLERSDLLDQTLTNAYPTRGTPRGPEIVQPALEGGHVHAWLAPGTPIEGFKTATRAYENQYQYQDHDRDRMQVTVVLNDERMNDEQETAASIYREHTANLPIDVTFRDGLRRHQLGQVFEDDNDFVHYIGHCEDDGLRCPDGNLDVAELESSRTQTFFLNACGSYEQGRSLIEKGAVTGAVTFRTVLDQQAARVGTAFARLLVHGFSFERALSLARRRILMGKDYAVVGDGTYALLPSPKQPAVVWVEDGANGDYDVTCEIVNARSNGARYQTPFTETPVLNGTTQNRVLTPTDLRDALEGTSVPVVYEGDVNWSENVIDCLTKQIESVAVQEQ